MSFLGIKIIFKTVINYTYGLVQIQQIPLAEWKQRSERLRNVTVIVKHLHSFSQTAKQMLASHSLPWLPRHSKSSSKQGCGLCQRHILLFHPLLRIYLAWPHWNQQARGWKHIIPFLTGAVPSDLLGAALGHHLLNKQRAFANPFPLSKLELLQQL